MNHRMDNYVNKMRKYFSTFDALAEVAASVIFNSNLALLTILVMKKQLVGDDCVHCVMPKLPKSWWCRPNCWIALAESVQRMATFHPECTRFWHQAHSLHPVQHRWWRCFSAPCISQSLLKRLVSYTCKNCPGSHPAEILSKD